MGHRLLTSESGLGLLVTHRRLMHLQDVIANQTVVDRCLDADAIEGFALHHQL